MTEIWFVAKYHSHRDRVYKNTFLGQWSARRMVKLLNKLFKHEPFHYELREHTHD